MKKHHNETPPIHDRNSDEKTFIKSTSMKPLMVKPIKSMTGLNSARPKSIFKYGQNRLEKFEKDHTKKDLTTIS